MEQIATPGSILLSAATFSLAEGFVVAKPIGPVLVKGVAQPVPAYEHVAMFPDAQTVVVVLCYAADAGVALDRKNVLIGHSLIQSPPPETKGSRKAK